MPFDCIVLVGMLAVKFVANRIRLFLRFFLAKVWLLLIAVIKPGLQVSHKFSYAELRLFYTARHTLVIFQAQLLC